MIHKNAVYPATWTYSIATDTWSVIGACFICASAGPDSMQVGYLAENGDILTAVVCNACWCKIPPAEYDDMCRIDKTIVKYYYESGSSLKRLLRELKNA